MQVSWKVTNSIITEHNELRQLYQYSREYSHIVVDTNNSRNYKKSCNRQAVTGQPLSRADSYRASLAPKSQLASLLSSSLIEGG